MQHLRERWLQGVCKTVPYTESGGEKKEYRALYYLKEIFQLQQCKPILYLPYEIRFRCSSYAAKLAGLPIFAVSFFEQELSEQER